MVLNVVGSWRNSGDEELGRDQESDRSIVRKLDGSYLQTGASL